MANLINKLATPFSKLFFPQLCLHCQEDDGVTDIKLCVSCQACIPVNDNAMNPNLVEQRLQHRFAYEHAISHTLLVRQGVVSSIIHSLKYKGNKEIGIWCGAQIAMHIKPFVSDIDGIIAVPLHQSKLFSRGYNQANIMAEGIGAYLSLPVISKAVIRSIYTDSQTRKNRRERLHNVTNVFVVRDAEVMKNKHLLLIDDVLTTGATLEALALVLLPIEGVKISVASFAMATG